MRTTYIIGRLGIAAFITTCVLTVVAQRDLTPLPIEDAILAKSFHGQSGIGSWSADGEWFAYAVTDSRREPVDPGRSSLIYTKTGVPRQTSYSSVRVTNILTDETLEVSGPTSWAPVWSPVGSLLAFYSDRDGSVRLWVWEPQTKNLRRVSDAIVRPIIAFDTVKWTPDGKSIITKILPAGLSVNDANRRGQNKLPDDRGESVAGSSVKVFRWSAGKKETETVSDTDAIVRLDAFGPHEANADLAFVDVKSGQIRRIATNLVGGNYWMSPDTTMLAYTTGIGWSRLSLQSYCDLSVVNLATGESRTLASLIPMQFGTSVSWAPNGSLLAYTTWGPPPRDVGDVYVVDPKRGQPRSLTPGTHPNFGSDYSPPLWSPDGSGILTVADDRVWRLPMDGTPVAVTHRTDRSLIEIVPSSNGTPWTADGGQSIFVGTRDDSTKRVGWAKIDLKSGKVTQLIEEDKKYGNVFQVAIVSADGKSVAYLAEDAVHDRDIWMAGVDFTSPRQITHATKSFENLTFGKSRLVEYRNGQGQILHGALLLPAGYEAGKKYPLLVNVYPGPYKRSNQLNWFGLDGGGFSNMQILATRGYAVLLPETPQRVGTPVQDLTDGVLSAVNKVVELGIADPERLGVFGQSYGGYSTAALVTQTTRFKAAVMSAGFGNLVSGYGAMTDSGETYGIYLSEGGQVLMGGTLWEQRNRYIENSPIFYLDRVQTPLLIVHGTRDTGVPVWQSDAVFVGLRRLNKEVEYRRYEGESHVIQGFENTVDYWNSVVRWFDKYLKAPETKVKTVEGR